MNLASGIDFLLEDEEDFFEEDFDDLSENEPTDLDLDTIDEEDDGLAEDWSLVTCPHCGYTFDITQTKAFDEMGQVICPKCKRSQ